MNMTSVREINFEIDVDNGKYTIRWFKDGSWDVLRFSEPWLDPKTDTIRGVNMWIALMFEVHAWRTGQGSAPALLPRTFAEEIVNAAKLPRDGDGKSPLPITREKLIELISLAITKDRERGPLHPTPIIDAVLHDAPDWATYTRAQTVGLIRAALTTAQARGARIEKKTIGEDDYAEASRAGHEAFMSCLKDKGLV